MLSPPSRAGPARSRLDMCVDALPQPRAVEALVRHLCESSRLLEGRRSGALPLARFRLIVAPTDGGSLRVG